MKMLTSIAALTVMMLAFALVLAPAAVLARPVSDDAIIMPNGEVKAGITPDSPLHFFDRFFDGLSLSLVSGPEKRAEKAMEIARERLMEAKEMVEKDNLGAARRAQRGHSSALAAVDDSIRRGCGSSSSQAELECEVSIGMELMEHEHEVESVRIKLEAEKKDIGSNGMVISLLKGRSAEVELEAEMEKEDSLRRVRSERGMSDLEISQMVQKLEDNAVRSRRGSREVEVELERGKSLEDRNRIRAFVAGDDSQARVELEFSTTETDSRKILGELLSRLDKNRVEVEDALEVEREREEKKDGVMTVIKVRDGVADVRFRADFPVSGTSREAIASAIANRLESLSEDKLELSSRFDRRGENKLGDDNSGKGSSGSGRDDDRGEFGTATDRRRGADKPEDDVNGEDELFDRRRGADKPEDDGIGDGVEDVRGNADENEIRGREAEARGREAEGEAPKGMDDASDFDSTPDSRGGSSGGSSGSGRGGGSSDD
ncbi:hypothetical protein HYU17_01025 [Candidatus Woesearchaeota archaeon]|nr:hypothetical protein [Candidatus Woesearchaeota archaeon]